MEINEKKIKTNYILIDYENVQPSSLDLSSDYPFKVVLFVGANQTKIPIELAASMQTLGNCAEYVRINGAGKNALDFCMVFYLGKFFEKDSGSYFHIISKDTGFDSLIKHLREQKCLIQRHSQVNDIPLLKLTNSKTINEKIEAIVVSLVSRGNSKPRKVETLTNMISALFMKALDTEELEKLIKELLRKNLITIQDGKVHYQLANEET